MSRVEPAQFCRWVGDSEDMEDLIEEAKALTWEFESEHALLFDGTQRRFMVRGGRDGILFGWNSVYELGGDRDNTRIRPEA